MRNSVSLNTITTTHNNNTGYTKTKTYKSEHSKYNHPSLPLLLPLILPLILPLLLLLLLLVHFLNNNTTTISACQTNSP